MEDKEIIELFFERHEEAISQTAKKYGAYCNTIANNILHHWQDVEECVNDCYIRLWNSIPPTRPNSLSAFLAKIVRNLAFDKYSKLHSDKRGGYEIPIILDELSEVLTKSDDRFDDSSELSEAINDFLRSLPKEKRKMMVLRYWYSYSVKEIAERLEVSENNVSVTLNRLRGALKEYLLKKGFKL